MGNISLDKVEWDSVISQAKSAVSSVGTLKDKKLTKNNLVRITNATTMAGKIGTKMKNYKNSAEPDFKKMKEIAIKITEQDKMMAAMIKNGYYN
jgi:hypothetical protein